MMNYLEKNGTIQNLSSEEIQEIVGGFLTEAVLIALACYVASEWPNIKQGVSDGWNGR